MTLAEAAIFSAFFTIADPSPPTLGTPTGSGWTTTDWVDRDVPISAVSSDETGILDTHVIVDGSIVATRPGTCSYDRPRPCADETSGAVTVPTAGLADGAHQLALGVSDAAGNETRVTRAQPLMVDTHAPAAPVGLGAAAPISATNAFAADWRLPADAGTPIVAARYQLCQDGTCGPARTTAQLTHVDGLSLPHAGTGTLRAWLVDRLGHEAPASAATIALTYAPPGVVAPAPLVPITDPPQIACCDIAQVAPQPVATRGAAKLRLTTLRRIGRRVTIAGSIAAQAGGRVTLRYQARIHGHSASVTTRVAIRRGAWRTTITLPARFAATQSATVTASYAGDGDTAPQSRSAVIRRSR